MSKLKSTGLLLAPAVFVVLLFLPPPPGLEPAAWRTASVAMVMAILWITEAIPIPATSLIPIILFPLLGVSDIKQATAPYAHPLVFLFMGGFVIALAMQRWNLHRRIALNIISFIGLNARSIIAGFMVATAFLSMWVSNTATTLMMLPIALSVIEVAGQKQGDEKQKLENFNLALLLGLAYSASIGGLGTLIGTPPNAFMAAFLNETYGYQITFARWMLLGVPLVMIGLPVTFMVLCNIVFPIRIKSLAGGKEFIAEERKKLGPLSNAEKMVAMVFVSVALLWIIQPVISRYIGGLSDTTIAILGAVVLFFLPVSFRRAEFVMNWHYAEKLPWGVLLLFGGGLSLASAINETGLATWIGEQLSALSGWPVLVLAVAVTVIIIFLTELTSNTATAAAFLPIMAGVAVGIGQNPLLFVVPAALAASCAFMLPVATPPNAIVFGSGKLTIPQMAIAGILLNIAFVLIITLIVFSLGRLVFGIEIGVTPQWL